MFFSDVWPNGDDRPSNSDKLLAAAVLYDTETGRAIGQPLHHNDDAFSPTFAPDGSWYATISDDRTVRRADGHTGVLLAPPLRLPLRNRFIKTSPRGDLLITGIGHLIEVAKWRVVRELTPLEPSINAAFFSPDQLWLATASARRAEDDAGGQIWSYLELVQWDVQSGLRVAGSIQVPDDEQRTSAQWLESMQWLKPGRSLAIGSKIVWNCTFPCQARTLLPLLRAWRPVILQEDGERIINTAWSVPAVSEVARTHLTNDVTALNFAERLLNPEDESDFWTNPAPRKFRVNYPHDDPGYREWTRKGEEWEEKPPTTGTKAFITKGRESVEKRSGTVLTRKGESDFEVFVSDRDVADPWIYFRTAGGKWKFLGKMEDVE